MLNTYPSNPWPLNTEQKGGGGGSYELPIASAETLGGVMVGEGLEINAETGVLSASGGALNYSTSEQDTGVKWIDNKKIYQKTILFDTTVSGGTSIDLTACAIDRVIDAKFHLGAQQNLQIAGGIGYYNGAADFINGYYNETDKKFYFRYGTYWQSATNYITIFYTKTEV